MKDSAHVPCFHLASVFRFSLFLGWTLDKENVGSEYKLHQKLASGEGLRAENTSKEKKISRTRILLFVVVLLSKECQ